MAGFHTKTFLKHDDYMTPKHVWESIQQFIPKDKIIWESFYGDGASGKHLQDLGFNVLHDQDDFFESNKGDIIVSNPPFSQSKEVLKRCVALNKPFILIFPSSKIHTLYVRALFKDQVDNPLQIIVPRKRINFEKHVEGSVAVDWVDKCNFDCFFYCWKMNLPKNIIWLE